MELRHLRYFIAVAEEEHITRAAERLGMHQPPLSQQIMAIERELDVKLLHRKARGVELTDAGRVFLDNARLILSRMDYAIETTRRTARGEQGQICVGVTATAPFHPFVPRVIRTFRQAFPLVSFKLEEHLSIELIDRLRGERIDAAFIRTSIANPEDLLIDALLEEPLVVALPSGHALVRRDRGDSTLSLKELSRETFIFFGPPGTGIHDATIAACQAAGFSPRVDEEIPRIASTLNLVAAGLGISIVPASLQRMKITGVTYRRLSGKIQPKAILALASRRGDRSAVVQHFRNLVKATAKNSS